MRNALVRTYIDLLLEPEWLQPVTSTVPAEMRTSTRDAHVTESPSWPYSADGSRLITVLRRLGPSKCGWSRPYAVMRRLVLLDLPIEAWRLCRTRLGERSTAKLLRL